MTLSAPRLRWHRSARRLALPILLIGGVAPANAQQQRPDGDTASVPLERVDLERWLDRVVPDALQRGDIAGLVVAVVKDGVVLLEKGYGYADVARKTPMDPARSVIRVASVSKLLTATAVLQLVEQGVLELDRDIRSYLDFDLPAGSGPPITLRHLLTHTAGFSEIAYPRYRPPRTLREHVVNPPPRIYPAGTVPAYSNYGFNLAGYLVERMAQMSFGDYLEHRIFLPLGMQHSTVRMVEPGPLGALIVPTYQQASAKEPYPPGLMAEMSPTDSPSGGLATTAHDMTRFMLMQLQGGRYGETRLLLPASVAEMQAPAFIPIPGAQPLGLGLFRSDYRGVRAIGHSGDGEGAHAELKLFPEQGIGVFVAVNSSGAADPLLPAAFSLRARLFRQFADRYLPVTSRPDEPTAATASEHALLVAGEYAWTRRTVGDYREAFELIGRSFFRPAIRANADGTIETTPALAFQSEGRTQTWREIAPFVWRDVDGDARLVMSVRDGGVQAVWSDAAPSVWVSTPVPWHRSTALHLPLLGLVVVAFTLVSFGWAVIWIVARRARSAGSTIDQNERSGHWTRVAAVVGLVYLAGWAIAFVLDAPSHLGSQPWIRGLQLIGLICIAGAALSLREAWRSWRRPKLAWTLVESTVTAMSLLYLVWFSFAFRLLSLRLG